ncbi:MAG: exo-alpha-sialidase, partial [Acidobacteria bacterium]|nr:exo-alpha-sialidase [Acidobacteriota bacterium]
MAADPRQPATLYAGGAGLLKSTDGGKTWTTLRADLQVRAIAVSPADAAVVYAGATDGCLKGTTAPSYRSADGGKTWTAIGGNLTSYAPHSTRAEIVFAASCSGVARSTDGGKTWQSLEGSRPAGYDVARVALAPSAPDVVYALSASEGGTVAVTKSEDGGKSWRNVTPREEMWAPTALAIDPGNPKVAYSVTGKGAFRTTDGGAGWTSANAGLDGIRHVDSSFVSYPLSALALDPTRPEVLYLGTGGGRPEGAGVFRSWDGARQWHRVGDGLGTRPVRDLTFAGGLVFAATSD